MRYFTQSGRTGVEAAPEAAIVSSPADERRSAVVWGVTKHGGFARSPSPSSAPTPRCGGQDRGGRREMPCHQPRGRYGGRRHSRDDSSKPRQRPREGGPDDRHRPPHGVCLPSDHQSAVHSVAENVNGQDHVSGARSCGAVLERVYLRIHPPPERRSPKGDVAQVAGGHDRRRLDLDAMLVRAGKGVVAERLPCAERVAA